MHSLNTLSYDISSICKVQHQNRKKCNIQYRMLHVNSVAIQLKAHQSLQWNGRGYRQLDVQKQWVNVSGANSTKLLPASTKLGQKTTTQNCL